MSVLDVLVCIFASPVPTRSHSSTANEERCAFISQRVLSLPNPFSPRFSKSTRLQQPFFRTLFEDIKKPLMYTHLGRIMLGGGRNKNQKKEMLRKSLLQSFLLLVQIPELCVDENDENSSRKKRGRTIAPEPITDTKLCQTMTFVRTKRRESCAKIEKKISYELKISCVGGCGRWNSSLNASFIADLECYQNIRYPNH